jgi:hypothetical protein
MYCIVCMVCINTCVYVHIVCIVYVYTVCIVCMVCIDTCVYVHIVHIVYVYTVRMHVWYVLTFVCMYVLYGLYVYIHVFSGQYSLCKE